MKKRFLEYHKFSIKELEELWNSALFVFDTNFLLNMYRFSKKWVENYLRILTTLKKQGKLRIPYQVGLEFYNNRLDVIAEYEDSYDNILLGLDNIETNIENDYKEHPSLELETIKKFFNPLREYINSNKENHVDRRKDDTLLTEIEDIFEGCVWEDFKEGDKNSILEDWKQRYEKKIPPGFKDKHKNGDNKYGDFFIWKQILEKAKEDKKPIIFVSGDIKEDWRLEKNGKKVMPLPLLKDEMYKYAWVDFHIYTPTHFVDIADNVFKLKIIDEVKKEYKRIDIESELNQKIERNKLAHENIKEEIPKSIIYTIHNTVHKNIQVLEKEKVGDIHIIKLKNILFKIKFALKDPKQDTKLIYLYIKEILFILQELSKLTLVDTSKTLLMRSIRQLEYIIINL